MFLCEHEAKSLLERFGVPIPAGILVDSPEAPLSLPPPVMVKAQVAAGGRGKAGAVRLARTEAEARRHVDELLGSEVSGHRVRQVLVEEAVPIRKECYLSLLLDRGVRGPLLLASASGGVDVEATDAAGMLRLPVDALLGLQPYMVRRAAAHLGVGRELHGLLGQALQGMWRCFAELECELVEVNPLALTPAGAVVALDARVVVDDRSLARHPGLRREAPDIDPLERAAVRLAVYPVRMQGDIAVAAAGAGALMATLDYVQALGGTLAGGLDLGGVVGHHPDQLTEALRMTREFGPRAFLFNFYVRTWKGDVIARSVLEAVGDLHPRIPVIVRLAGNRSAEGHAILREAGIPVTASFLEACAQAARAVR